LKERDATNIDTLTSGLIQVLCKKNSWIACGFAREYLRSCTVYGPGQSVKRCGKSSSLHCADFLATLANFTWP